MDSQKGKTYNLVNSIKGGCGKTTLSIWLAAYLDFLSHTKGKVCIFDMDLQGSCMVGVFEGSESDFDKYHYLQELIRGYRTAGMEFIQDIQLMDKFQLSVIYSSPKQKDKAAFYSGAASNYSPIMEYGTFRLGLKRFIKDNPEMEKRGFQHIIFDMPPNADGYSDAALECVLNPRHSVVEKSDRINLFMMMTLDVSHMMATISGIKEIYSETNNRIPDRLFIVFNTNIVTNISAAEQERLFFSKKEIIEKAIEKMGLAETVKNNIFFLIMNQNIDYADVCARGKGLRNCSPVESRLFETGPFQKYAAYKSSEFKAMEPDALSELIIG